MPVALISDALRRRERAQAREREVVPSAAAAELVSEGRKEAFTGLLQSMLDELHVLRADVQLVRALLPALKKDLAADTRIETALNGIEQRLQSITEPKPLIREPAVQPVAAPPMAPSLAVVPAAALPDPPRPWDMKVMTRDPNGAIVHVRWTPADG